jgi:hypothetical protein
MTDITATTQAHFESLVVGALLSTKAQKKKLAPLMKQVRASEIACDDPAHLLRIGEAVENLLGSVTRNTSPFYVRQVSALTCFFCEALGDQGPAATLPQDELEAVVNRTAVTVHKQWFQVKPA